MSGLLVISFKFAQSAQIIDASGRGEGGEGLRRKAESVVATKSSRKGSKNEAEKGILESNIKAEDDEEEENLDYTDLKRFVVFFFPSL
jgi:hypothetical protein